MKKIRLIEIPLPQEAIDELLEQTRNLSKEDRDKLIEETKINGVFKYKSVLLSVMRTPLDARSGVSIEEMERTLPIISLIKQVPENGVLEMDDTDWQYLERKLEVVRMTGFDERWITLKHTIVNATKDLLEV